MKNVDLNVIFARLVASGIKNYNLNFLVKEKATVPTDLLITVDIADLPETLNKRNVEEILHDSFEGDVKSFNIELKDKKLEIYIEFLGGDSTHWNH
jgi:hypothetical protein